MLGHILILLKNYLEKQKMQIDTKILGMNCIGAGKQARKNNRKDNLI